MAKCCNNKLIWRSIVGIPPDIDPPVSEPSQYVYALGILGDSYDPNNDIYAGLYVDGVNYNSGGGVLLNMDLDPTVQGVFMTDLTNAGLVDATNDGTYWGITFIPGLTPVQYFFLIVTDAPHTISVDLRLSGNLTNIPITGGAVTIVDYCTTFTTPDASGEAVDSFTFTVDNELGNPVDINYSWGGSVMADTNDILSNFSAYINTFSSQILPYTSNFTDNGNGTVTLTFGLLGNYVVLKNINSSAGLENSSLC